MKVGAKLFAGVFVIGLLLIVSGIWLNNMFGAKVQPQIVNVPGQQPGPTYPTTPTTTVSGECPDSGATDLYLQVRNALDNTQVDRINVTGYLYDKESGAKVATVTATDGLQLSANDINCGRTYVFRIISTNAYRGVDARILDVEYGNAKVIEDGKAIEFKATGARMDIGLKINRHGILEFKAYDEVDKAYMYAAQGSPAYYQDGVTWKSTSNTTIAMGVGGYIDVSIDFRTNETYTNFNDFGTYILVDAAASEYNEPVVKLDGVTLTNVKGQLTTYEARAFSDYEYVYKIDTPITKSGSHTLRFYIDAISGVDPSSDIQIDLAAIGAYLSTDGYNVKYGAVDDTSSTSAVFSIQDMTLDMA